jgi:hypothetical protein
MALAGCAWRLVDTVRRSPELLPLSVVGLHSFLEVSCGGAHVGGHDQELEQR